MLDLLNKLSNELNKIHDVKIRNTLSKIQHNFVEYHNAMKEHYSIVVAARTAGQDFHPRGKNPYEDFADLVQVVQGEYFNLKAHHNKASLIRLICHSASAEPISDTTECTVFFGTMQLLWNKFLDYQLLIYREAILLSPTKLIIDLGDRVLLTGNACDNKYKAIFNHLLYCTKKSYLEPMQESLRSTILELSNYAYDQSSLLGALYVQKKAEYAGLEVMSKNLLKIKSNAIANYHKLLNSSDIVESDAAYLKMAMFYIQDSDSIQAMYYLENCININDSHVIALEKFYLLTLSSKVFAQNDKDMWKKNELPLLNEYANMHSAICTPKMYFMLTVLNIVAQNYNVALEFLNDISKNTLYRTVTNYLTEVIENARDEKIDVNALNTFFVQKMFHTNFANIDNIPSESQVQALIRELKKFSDLPVPVESLNILVNIIATIKDTINDHSTQYIAEKYEIIDARLLNFSNSIPSTSEHYAAKFILHTCDILSDVSYCAKNYCTYAIKLVEYRQINPSSNAYTILGAENILSYINIELDSLKDIITDYNTVYSDEMENVSEALCSSLQTVDQYLRVNAELFDNTSHKMSTELLELSNALDDNHYF